MHPARTGPDWNVSELRPCSSLLNLDLDLDPDFDVDLDSLMHSFRGTTGVTCGALLVS